MGAVAFREKGKAGPVEIDPGEVDVIGALILMDASGAEPDLALFVVDFINAPDEPFAFRDLVLHLPLFGIVEVKVVPAVALKEALERYDNPVASQLMVPESSSEVTQVKAAQEPE